MQNQIFVRFTVLIFLMSLVYLGIQIQACAPAPLVDVSVGGIVTGNTGTVVLQEEVSEDVYRVREDGDSYFFIVEQGISYNITIVSEPAGQTCTFVNDNNSGIASDVQIDNIDIVCTDDTSNKIIFITAATHNGDFNGISGTDAFCMADANKPNSSTYKALIAGSAVRTACATPNCSMGTFGQTDWVLAPNTTYFRSDGTTEIGTTNSNGIFTFPLTASFLGTASNIWTGLSADWTTSVDTCLNGISVLSWDTSSGGTSGSFGTTNEITDEAIFNGGEPCSFTLNLACVEQ